MTHGAEVTNVDPAPEKGPDRYRFWCDHCRIQTHLALGFEEPTCDLCGTPFERPEIAPSHADKEKGT